jgi:hypothetical protein
MSLVADLFSWRLRFPNAASPRRRDSIPTDAGNFASQIRHQFFARNCGIFLTCPIFVCQSGKSGNPLHPEIYENS